MLTHSAASLRPRRLAATLATLGPTSRLARPGLAALTVGLGAGPALITLALGGQDLSLPLVLAGLVAGAALGWAVDDPVAELLASMPTSEPIRAVIRVGAVALVAGAGIAALLAAVAVGPGLPSHVWDRLPEAAAAGAAALAVALVAARRGERAPGVAAVTAGVFGVAFLAALSFRFRQLPSFTAGPHHARWWVVAAVAMLVALHAGRDPGRR